MSGRIYTFIVLIIILLLAIGGCRRAGRWLVRDDVPVHSDAIVILMGNFADRVLQAADLYNEGIADRVIIVEEGMGQFRTLEERGASIISNSEQARNAAVTLGIPADSIIVLPGWARSTLEEAAIVREYIQTSGNTDTLLLVTTSYHTRRASLIFSAALSSNLSTIYIGSSPSAYTDFNSKQWWKEREGIQAVASEYVKIVSFMLFEKSDLHKTGKQ